MKTKLMSIKVFYEMLILMGSFGLNQTNDQVLTLCRFMISSIIKSLQWRGSIWVSIDLVRWSVRVIIKDATAAATKKNSKSSKLQTESESIAKIIWDFDGSWRSFWNPFRWFTSWACAHLPVYAFEVHKWTIKWLLEVQSFVFRASSRLCSRRDVSGSLFDYIKSDLKS